jgi:hypothetical protein
MSKSTKAKQKVKTSAASGKNAAIKVVISSKAKDKIQLGKKLIKLYDILTPPDDDQRFVTLTQFLDDDELDIFYEYDDEYFDLIRSYCMDKFIRTIEAKSKKPAIYARTYDSIIVTKEKYLGQLDFWIDWQYKVSAELVEQIPVTVSIAEPYQILERNIVSRFALVVNETKEDISICATVQGCPSVSKLEQTPKIAINCYKIGSQFKRSKRHRLKKRFAARFPVVAEKPVVKARKVRKTSYLVRISQYWCVIRPPIKAVNYSSGRVRIADSNVILLDRYDK